VRPGSPLDTEALQRGTSVYFPRRVLPMLPPALSDHLCSLAPHVDRLCLVADMQLSRQGALQSTHCYAGVMRSFARLTYTQAHAALFIREVAVREQLGALLTKLEPLVEVYRLLQKQRRRRGALEFDASEASFEFDAAGRVKAVGRTQRNDAHRLIEECMILANVAVARELLRERTPALYRVHAPPDPAKIDRLQQSLLALKVAAELPEEPTPKDLRAIAERVGSAELQPLVESLVVRSLSQAQYQAPNIGHFGLALKEYAHFTSPIRRYPDLLVHRALRVQLDAQDPQGLVLGPEALNHAGTQLSLLERRAEESDRYVDTFLKCGYLRERVGQSFAGIVTTVTESGCFVQIVDVLVDGLLRLDRGAAQDFVMAPNGQAWISRRLRRELKLGTRIHVLVTAVNPVEGLVDLELAV
jgi:ribonuclease R